MIEVFEGEILAMVKKSQLKNIKLRRELDHARVINYLRVICNSSAKFYIKRDELETHIINGDVESINSTIETLKFEGARILNLVSDYKLDSTVVDDIVTKMVEKYYLSNICNY